MCFDPSTRANTSASEYRARYTNRDKKLRLRRSNEVVLVLLLLFLVANFYAGSQALDCTSAGYAIMRLRVALERTPPPASAANHGVEVKESRRMEFVRTCHKYHKANFESTHFSLWNNPKYET
jgi:hypothetical protein